MSASNVTLTTGEGSIYLTHINMPEFSIRVEPEIKKKTTLYLTLVKPKGKDWEEVTPRLPIGLNQVQMLSRKRSELYKEFSLPILSDTLQTDDTLKQILNEFVMILQQHKYEEDVGEIDLDAEVTRFVKPCGYYDDIIIECCYLPLRKSRAVTLSRAIVLSQLGKIEVKPFLEAMEVDNLVISGDFPSPDMLSLPSREAIKALKQMTGVPFNIEVFRAIDRVIEDSLRKHLFLSEEQYIFLKRYIEGTFFFDMMNAFPILNIMGSSENGKTRALLCVAAMGYHGDFLVDPTEAVLFRNKESVKPTLCIDEAEYLNDEGTRHRLKLLLNSSYSKSAGYVMRTEQASDGARYLKRFDLFSPVAIAGISGLEGVLRSRSLLLVMPRANRDFPKANIKEHQFVRDCMYVLRLMYGFHIRSIYDQTLEQDYPIEARYFELFRPVFAMTKLFGTEQEMQMLVRYAEQVVQNERNEAETNISDEQMILQILDILIQERSNEDERWYPLEEVCKELQQPPFQLSWRPQMVSNVLRRMGILRRHKISGRVTFYLERRQLNTLMRRYGLKAEDE